MSKKTKKQKILADLRRKMQQLQSVIPQGKSFLGQPTTILTGTQNAVPETPRTSPLTKYQLPTAPWQSRGEPVQTRTADYSYVLSDLKRIAILTVLAICAQIVLWYMLGRG